MAILLKVNERQKKTSLLREAMIKTLRLPADAWFASFEMYRVRKDIWNCFPIAVSSCCNTSERKDLSCVKHWYCSDKTM